jgi:hypothetical protein
MVETMRQRNKKTLLPFVNSRQVGVADFSDDMEKAAIFCLSELNRAKGGRFIGREMPEKLVFISKIYYPFWVAPFRDTTILVDGLKMSSHAITYSKMPNFKIFEDNLNCQSETLQAYTTFLENNLNYFRSRENEETEITEGLMTDIDFLNEFMSYLKEATSTKAKIVNGVLVLPENDKTKIVKEIQKLKELRKKFVVEVKDLNNLIKLLNLNTHRFLKRLHDKVVETKKRFRKKTKKSKAILDRITSKINKNYTHEITEISKRFEKKILAFHKKLLKFEKARDQCTSEIEYCEAEIKTSTINQDEITEHKWKEKRRTLKKHLPDTLSKIRTLEKTITKKEKQKKLAIFQAKTKKDAKIKEASKNLIALDCARDAEIRIYKGDMEKIEELTSNIVEQIDQLSRISEGNITEFERLGIPQKSIAPLLVHLPFYLICYQSESRKRYTFFPPSFVCNVGLGVRIKGAMSGIRIKQLFQPRCKKIISILNKFAVLLEENVVFCHEITEACHKANLLGTPNLRQSLKKGINELLEAQWLSERECESFIQTIT